MPITFYRLRLQLVNIGKKNIYIYDIKIIVMLAAVVLACRPDFANRAALCWEFDVVSSVSPVVSYLGDKKWDRRHLQRFAFAWPEIKLFSIVNPRWSEWLGAVAPLHLSSSLLRREPVPHIHPLLRRQDWLDPPRRRSCNIWWCEIRLVIESLLFWPGFLVSCSPVRPTLRKRTASYCCHLCWAALFLNGNERLSLVSACQWPEASKKSVGSVS